MLPSPDLIRGLRGRTGWGYPSAFIGFADEFGRMLTQIYEVLTPEEARAIADQLIG